MSYKLVNLAATESPESPLFIEGAVLAANFATRPVEPETWLTPLFGEGSPELISAVTGQIHQQYHYLKRNEYSLSALLSGSPCEESLADYAEGFMSVWPVIEPHWEEATAGDGTLRMLQALLTTFMLAIDEEQTQAQMKAAGYSQPPALSDFIGQLDLMVGEVAQAADELMLGSRSQSINPFRETGRNDPCPCGSGKKFKQCCGQPLR